jgi:peroxiredoxin
VELNAQLDAAAFAFKPPAGFKRVAQIGAADDPFGQPEVRPPGPTAEVEGGHLIGKPAPAISGKDLLGQPLVQEDLRGKVVLLFFWAMSGGEHSLRAIPIVQEVADHFKRRPEVLVLGISGEADHSEVVAQLMERKKASFRTLVDEEMKVQRTFELGGLPTFVVIGTDGQIKWARLGAPPSLKQDLISQIEKGLRAVGL